MVQARQLGLTDLEDLGRYFFRGQFGGTKNAEILRDVEMVDGA